MCSSQVLTAQRCHLADEMIDKLTFLRFVFKSGNDYCDCMTIVTLEIEGVVYGCLKTVDITVAGGFLHNSVCCFWNTYCVYTTAVF